MGYITHAELKDGETVQFRPRGNSMSPKIESEQLCTVSPADPESTEVGYIVLCKVNGNQYLHLVKAINGKRFQIGKNRVLINSWIPANSIYGRLAKVKS